MNRVRFGGICVAPARGQLREAPIGTIQDWRRVLLALALAFAIVLPAAAQETDGGAPWQSVITAQIQAFRDHDAPAAFSYAGQGFQIAFDNAEIFFEAIINSGYAPIMESVSHSFGAFQMLGESGVIQEVRFVGKDQELYGAMYQLTEEDEGWRVQGVQLFRQPGVAI